MARLVMIIGIALVLVIVIVVVIARFRGTSLNLHVARIVAALYVAISAVSTVALIVSTFVSNSVHVELPVAQFWPKLPPGATVDGLQANVVGGGISTASVDVAGLDLPTRFWLAGELLLQGSTGVVIGIAVVLLCTNVLRRNPFRLALVRAINVSAASVIVGGILWQFCGIIGGSLASDQVLHPTGTEWTNPVTIPGLSTIYGLPQSSVGSWTINLWPIGAGLTLLALSAAFRYGAKLQKDTEGLV